MNTTAKSNFIIILKLIVFCTLVYFPIFLHLDKLPIRIWDEARLAISAYEMHENGNFLIPFFKGEPDMWSTKPPLMIWLQVFFLKILGVGVLALRMPSAIAALLTTIVLLIFSIKYLKSYWFGLIAVLILVTSYGYVEEHAIRTGDYDSLLTFFTTSFLICFFLFQELRKLKYLHFFYVLLTLAILTKSVQGLIFLPAILMYIIIQRDWKLFTVKWLYIDLIISLFVILAYYLIRESVNPGYLQAVWENELGGRYLATLGKHKHDFDYYYKMLRDHHYKEWFFLLPFGIVIGLFSKNYKIGKLTLFIFLAAISYLLIISNSETKLQWYIVPLFPLMALLVAVVLNISFTYIKNVFYFNEQLRYNIMPYLFLILVFYTPYKNTLERVYFPEEYPWSKEFYTMSHFLHDAVDEKFSIENQYIAFDGYNAQLHFYTEILNDRNLNIILVEDWTQFIVGDKVSVYQNELKSFLQNNYELELLNERKGVDTFVVKGLN